MFWFLGFFWLWVGLGFFVLSRTHKKLFEIHLIVCGFCGLCMVFCLLWFCVAGWLVGVCFFRGKVYVVQKALSGQ